MIAVEKHAIHIKHVFKPYNKSNMLTIPLWNIRNKLCEATTKFSWAKNVEERHEFWCRNGDQGFQNRKLLV